MPKGKRIRVGANNLAEEEGIVLSWSDNILIKVAHLKNL
jgi:hypothetical protein